MQMQWDVIFHDDFIPEYRELSESVQNMLTLKGSRHANMKELRFDADGGVWRVAFAFDPDRKAILLVAGNKGGIGKQRFYRDLIRVADGRFDQHLNALRLQKRNP